MTELILNAETEEILTSYLSLLNTLSKLELEQKVIKARVYEKLYEEDPKMSVSKAETIVFANLPSNPDWKKVQQNIDTVKKSIVTLKVKIIMAAPDSFQFII